MPTVRSVRGRLLSTSCVKAEVLCFPKGVARLIPFEEFGHVHDLYYQSCLCSLGEPFRSQTCKSPGGVLVRCSFIHHQQFINHVHALKRWEQYGTRSSIVHPQLPSRAEARFRFCTTGTLFVQPSAVVVQHKLRAPEHPSIQSSYFTEQKIDQIAALSTDDGGCHVVKRMCYSYRG